MNQEEKSPDESIASMKLRPGFELASPPDFEIPHCVTTGPEAMAILRAHHSDWQQHARAIE
jgi:hypothetical protein